MGRCWGGEGRGGEARGWGCLQINPLAGDLHLKEIMRQLHYMGEVCGLWGGEVLGWGGEGWGGKGLGMSTNQPPSWRSTSERDYETTTLYGRGR